MENSTRPCSDTDDEDAVALHDAVVFVTPPPTNDEIRFEFLLAFVLLKVLLREMKWRCPARRVRVVRANRRSCFIIIIITRVKQRGGFDEHIKTFENLDGTRLPGRKRPSIVTYARRVRSSV